MLLDIDTCNGSPPAGRALAQRLSAAVRTTRSKRAVVALVGTLVGAAAIPVYAGPDFVRDGSAGFVVSDIKFALAEDAQKTGVCPKGMSLNASEIFAQTAKGKRKQGETDEQYAKRLDEGGRELSTAANGENLCLNPEAGGPDPFFRTVSARVIQVDGIPLGDRGQNSSGSSGPQSIQNQFYRVVGCSRSWQSTGLSNVFATEMLTGSWGILITLGGLQDLRNDENVEVGIYANADPIALSPTRVPLAYATYAMDQDPRFRAKTRGRIKDGVLTTDPVDVRFHWVVNGMHLERPLRHARLQLTLSPEGVLTGFLAGYTPVQAMYDMQYGYRNGRNGAGELSPLGLRLGTGNGAARVLGHTCQGAYFALQQYADGDLDTSSGQYTSISTQYRISAIPAFVVDVATQSSNSKLEEKAGVREH